MRRNLYVDLTGVSLHANPEGERNKIKEVVDACLRSEVLEIVPVLEHADRTFVLADMELFREGVVAATGKQVACADFRNGDIFLDFEAPGKHRWRRSGFLPLLKCKGVKVISLFGSSNILCRPSFYDESLLMETLDFLGASMEWSDKILALDVRDQELLERISGKTGKPVDCSLLRGGGGQSRRS